MPNRFAFDKLACKTDLKGEEFVSKEAWLRKPAGSLQWRARIPIKGVK
jgi:hypothetical protein